MTQSIASATLRRRFKLRLAPAILLLATLFGAGIFSDSCFAQANRGDDKRPPARAEKPLKWLPILAGEEKPDAEQSAEETTRDESTPLVDWKLLAFVYSDEPLPRRVVRVRIVFYKYGAELFGRNGREKPHPFDKEFSDAKTVGLVQLGLTRSLRAAEQLDGIGAMGNSPVGQLQVMTNREAFRIAMQEQGFGLGSEYVNTTAIARF